MGWRNGAIKHIGAGPGRRACKSEPKVMLRSEFAKLVDAGLAVRGQVRR